jgi:hypothetical protein
MLHVEEVREYLLPCESENSLSHSESDNDKKLDDHALLML